LEERVEGAGIGLARKNLIPVNQVCERHRLFAQGMNDMAVIDDVTGLTVVAWPAAPDRLA